MVEKRIQIAAFFAVTLLACGGEAVAPRAPIRPAQRKVTLVAKSPAASSYWKGLDLSYDPDIVAHELPIDPADLVRDEGAASLYASLEAADRASLLRDGFAVVKTQRARHHIGVFYTDLEEGHVPIVLTVDALAELAHLGISAAIGEAHARSEARALEDWLSRVEKRLVAEQKNAQSDLVAPYRVALGFVATARAFADAAYVPPPSLLDVVAKEKANVVAHARIAKSPVFGERIDYRTFPESADLRFRAWLAFAPFSLGANEGTRRHMDVARARTNTRAALLLARVTDARVDRDAADAYARARAIDLFLSGNGEDPDLATLADLAPKVGLDLADGRTIASVVRVDALRALLRAKLAPKLMQGETDERSIRALAAPVPLDGVAMQDLVTPSVPLRSLPSALDVAAWLGSEEARRQITVRGDDKLAGYSRSLTSLYASRPADSHASVYASALDAIGVMLAPSVSEAALPASRSPLFRALGVDTALAAWTTFRADFSGLSYVGLDTALPGPSATPHAAPTLVYVEPKLEAIASLTALVRQALRGLDDMHAVAATSPARAALRYVDELLTTAFEVALLAANDESPTATQRTALAALPAWMDELETAMHSDVVRSVVVHTDLAQDLRLEESTAPVSALYLAMREPATERLVLVVGAHVPHVERVAPIAKSP